MDLDPDDGEAEQSLSRRRFLSVGTMAVAGAGLAFAGCSGGSDDGSPSSTGPPSSAEGSGPAPTDTATDQADASGEPGDVSDEEAGSGVGTPADTVFTADDFASLGTCLVLPELMAGPFPTIEQVERRDITEGRPGHPLRVGIQVVDETCAPIPGALVEIWHCDVDGDYSAYADGVRPDDDAEGTTFLRGFQVANQDGIVEFHTIYPGWYPGRAIHIHSAVHLDDRTVLTTQFLFDDDVNTAMMALEPYARFGEPDTPNAADGVSNGRADSDGLLMAVSDDADIAGSRALIVVGVEP